MVGKRRRAVQGSAGLSTSCYMPGDSGFLQRRNNVARDVIGWMVGRWMQLTSCLLRQRTTQSAAHTRTRSDNRTERDRRALSLGETTGDRSESGSPEVNLRLGNQR